MKTTSKRSRLGRKLKQAVQDLAVDVFGYETTITKNILAYFTQLSHDTTIPKDELVVRVFRDRENIRVTIYNKGRLAKTLSVRALVKLFTNTEPSGVFGLEAKTIQGIKAFIENFARANSIRPEQLQICIMTHLDKVIVKAYDGTVIIKDIPLKVLINYFTS